MATCLLAGHILKTKYIWLFLFPVFVYGGYMALPRGIRNNNPGNIRHNDANNWRGQIGVDEKGFVIFDKVENGIRAMALVLQSYARRGVVYLVDIIYTWAPPVDGNDVRAYLEHVEKLTGIQGNQRVTEKDYPKLIAAITKHENGINPYTMAYIEKGVALA